jgi:hypothetical protein
MCAQWTNLGGVIFQIFRKFFEKYFEKYFLGWGKTGGGPRSTVWGGGSEKCGEVRRSAEKCGEVRRSAEKCGEVR